MIEPWKLSMVQFHLHWKAFIQKLDDLNLEKELAMQLKKMYMGKYPLSVNMGIF